MVQQKNKHIKIIPIILTIFAAFFLLNTRALAVSGEGGMGFTVSPVLPENQNNHDLGYFDLTVTLGTKQLISLNVNNTSNEEITLEVATTTASTSASGNINYSSVVPNDETLEYAFSDIAKPTEELVIIPANGSTVIYVEINNPAESFDGMILGSVRVKDITSRLKKEDSESSSSVGSVELINEYEYIVGVVLRENTNVITPDFELLSVKAETLHFRAGLTATYRNPKADAVKGATFSASITQKNGGAEIFSVKDFNIDMAPNSIMPFEFVDEAGYGIESGTYTLRSQIKYKNEVWDFEEDFTVSAADADSINNQAVNQQEGTNNESVWNLLIIGGIILLLVILIIILIIVLKSKKEKKA